MIHPTELESAQNAIDSLSEHQANATEALAFWHGRLRFALERYLEVADRDDEDCHPRQEHLATGVRSALTRYQQINRAIEQAAAE